VSRLLVTGSSGLIGSEMVSHFHTLGWEVHGVDNNQRAIFFGEAGDTRWNQKRLEQAHKGFVHHELDLRDREGIEKLIAKVKPDAIVHAAAQPSHDRAATIPFDDFDTNAVGTLNMLEGARRHAKDAPFVFLSTNKVYGDAPNELALSETATRWDFADAAYANGIAEDFRIDRSTHSLFGASKVAADIMTQEYGRYFGMQTCALRGGCLTGPSHSGVELHGFLSYLVKCNVEGRTYRVFGYKGKQVRDNIHARDVAKFAEAFIAKPRSGEVYNLGGGKQNACSILEAFAMVAERSGKPMKHEYDTTNRVGDHICYYSDLRKMRAHYPGWDITVPLGTIFDEIVDAWKSKARSS
jgi:CDP-paratose 2-epimerase